VTILQIDIDPGQLGNNLRTEVATCGDIKESLAALLRLMDEQEATVSSREVSRNDLERLWKEHWSQVSEPAASADYPLAPQRVIDTLWHTAPDDVVIVADPGTMTPYTASQFRVRHAGRSIVIPRAHGGLGYALPATVGAAYARPNQRIVGLVGDGSFGMSGMELETISRLHLPITLVHFNNGTFGWIKMLQKLNFDKRYFGVDFSPTTDYVGIARALGVRGVRIEHPDQLDAALAEALSSDEPVFIDVPTKSELEEVPPVHAWQQAISGQLASR
jgi:acetolactate synthase-1/2/3 large subunit